MSKETSKDIADKTPPSGSDPKSVAPINREALMAAIESELQRVFRARAIAQTAAKLLRELYISERDEPDIGFVLDVVPACWKTRSRNWIA